MRINKFKILFISCLMLLLPALSYSHGVGGHGGHGHGGHGHGGHGGHGVHGGHGGHGGGWHGGHRPHRPGWNHGGWNHGGHFWGAHTGHWGGVFWMPNIYFNNRGRDCVKSCYRDRGVKYCDVRCF